MVGGAAKGLFVNYIPELRRLPPSEIINVFTATPAHLGFEEYDVTNQIAASHHYWVMDHQLKDIVVSSSLRTAL